jgi:hypothetical protein
MARVIRLGDYWRLQPTPRVEKLLEFAVLETDTLLKSTSPVDLGRFRLSWAIGQNASAIPRYAARRLSPPGKPAPPALRRMNYSKERPGNIYSVHNNLPYAEPLANGSSKQANAGWVQGIAKDVQGRVIAAAAKIGRES